LPQEIKVNALYRCCKKDIITYFAEYGVTFTDIPLEVFVEREQAGKDRNIRALYRRAIFAYREVFLKLYTVIDPRLPDEYFTDTYLQQSEAQMIMVAYLQAVYPALNMEDVLMRVTLRITVLATDRVYLRKW